MNLLDNIISETLITVYEARCSKEICKDSEIDMSVLHLAIQDLEIASLEAIELRDKLKEISR